MYTHTWNNYKAVFMEIHFIFKAELPAVKVCIHFGGQAVLSSPCDLPLILLSWRGGARRHGLCSAPSSWVISTSQVSSVSLRGVKGLLSGHWACRGRGEDASGPMALCSPMACGDVSNCHYSRSTEGCAIQMTACGFPFLMTFRLMPTRKCRRPRKMEVRSGPGHRL